ncbi:unnamed protein product [Candida parapsilosis]
MSIDEQLRILALKEMAIVQIKDRYKPKQETTHTRRRIAQASRSCSEIIVQEISGAASNTRTNRQRTNSNPRDQAIETIRAKRRSSSEVVKIDSRRYDSSVSASIWSFVNEVKQNVLSSLSEEDLTVSNDFDVDDQVLIFHFQATGIGNLVATRIQEAEELGKKIIVFSSSGGNAGLAAAYAAKYYKVECTVVLPEVTKPEVVDKLKGLGLMLFFTVLIGEKPTRTCEKLSLKNQRR